MSCNLTIRLAYSPNSLQPALHGFDVDAILPREHVDPADLTQVAEQGGVVNVAGYVTGVRGVSSLSTGLPRRSVDLCYGDYALGVDVLGALTQETIPKAQAVIIYSCKVNLWLGIPSLESTRLSFVRRPRWLVIPDPSADGPPRKAL